MNGRITQADVAKKAGVHVTTVSLALRNHPQLPLATRRWLQALAAQMGYRPDPALSALMAYRRGARQRKDIATLAYVTNAGGRWHWKSAPAHAQFFAGASDRAQQLGFKLEHFWLGEPALTQKRMNDILVSRGINGLIFSSHWGKDRDSVELDWAQFSAVKIDFQPRTPVLPSVTNDQRGIIQLALRRVLAAGYRRIGFVMPRWWNDYVDLAWSAGFLAEQAKLPVEEHIPILYYAGEMHSDGSPAETPEWVVPRNVLSSWLQRYRPEVLISSAVFVNPTLAALGLQTPRDIAFVEIFLEDTGGRIAGVRQNCTRVGELAVELLVSQLQQHVFGLPQFQTTTLVEGTWFDGDTLPVRR